MYMTYYRLRNWRTYGWSYWNKPAVEDLCCNESVWLIPGTYKED